MQNMAVLMDTNVLLNYITKLNSTWKKWDLYTKYRENTGNRELHKKKKISTDISIIFLCNGNG